MKKESLIFDLKSSTTEIDLAIEWLGLLTLEGKDQRNLNRALNHLLNVKNSLEDIVNDLSHKQNYNHQIKK